MDDRKRVCIIGAGAVGRVTTHKCAQHEDVFSEICLASRTLAKCEKIASELKRLIRTEALDAEDIPATVALLRDFKPDIVINVAQPYQNLAIMEACLEVGVDYIDTACYEPREAPDFHYGWQWAYHDRFVERGLMALLGCGFDPGVTNAWAKKAKKDYFNRIDELDIVDINGGSHGQAFATNFNPETNIREITKPCRHIEDGNIVETPPFSTKRYFRMPGHETVYSVYRLWHEELETITKFIPEIRNARFWMSFSESYLQTLDVLQKVGMTSIEPIDFKGQKIVPLEFLKAVLPDPATLGESSHGPLWIGDILRGEGKDGRPRQVCFYCQTTHEHAYADTRANGVAYTAGVPPASAAILMVKGIWRQPGTICVEQLDPDPFLDQVAHDGLPWQVLEDTNPGWVDG
ncbi:MAG: saccharopine dehydrogenase family protein [Lentisphaerae bacterium]|nr:MAG: saccharopine dehydrogenase family protein [Lentisphaerota bacterium]